MVATVTYTRSTDEGRRKNQNMKTRTLIGYISVFNYGASPRRVQRSVVSKVPSVAFVLYAAYQRLRFPRTSATLVMLKVPNPVSVVFVL